MSTGSAENSAKTHNLLAFGLVAVIAICAVLLGTREEHLSTAWTVGLSVISAVAGALLGNIVRIDLTQNVFRAQARPATRHLLDQVRRLQSLVVRVEKYGAECRSGDIDNERAADWFAGIGNDLRDEIEATATAIDNWSDLASDVREEEWSKYLTRQSRLPGPADNTSEKDNSDG